jgi:hypothetical protein
MSVVALPHRCRLQKAREAIERRDGDGRWLWLALGASLEFASLVSPLAPAQTPRVPPGLALHTAPRRGERRQRGLREDA